MQIILHIGQPKTASTTIQAYLAQNRKRLAARGVLYPAALGDHKATALSDLNAVDEKLTASQEQIIARMQAEFSGGYDRAILSNETLFATGKSTLTRLKRVLDPFATSYRVLCYIRRPDEHVASQYQQKVKSGYVGTFEGFFAERLNGGYYEYTRFLDRWAQVFGQEAVELRLFHRKALRGGPIDDFLQWTGIDPAGLSSPERGHANESLDPIGTEIVRLLHLGKAEDPDLAGKSGARRIVARLRDLDTGQRLRLDGERARLLHETVRSDHERLAALYLPPDQAGLLLAPPAETPPQPPLDGEALFARMSAVFADPDLARRLMETAARAGAAEGPRRGRKGPKTDRILQRQARQAKHRTWWKRALRFVRGAWRARSAGAKPGSR
ncbi:MAG TPA: hypothetical protein VHL98_00920 [Microvirga sp.]|jgi:hypothetical protein|nr:hypothetical protein [Microvirga sp.]